MELKEGMYVRTERGVIFKYYPCKNTEYDNENNIYHEWANHIPKQIHYIDKATIINKLNELEKEND